MTKTAPETPSFKPETDIRVFARTNWEMALTVLLGPFLLLIALYFLLSSRSFPEVTSYENVTASTPFRPNPIVGITCAAIYLGLVAFHFVSLLLSRGKFLWTEGGFLMVGGLKKVHLDLLSPENIVLDESSWPKKLVIQRRNGPELVIRLGLAHFDRIKLADLVRAEIVRHKEASTLASRPDNTTPV